MQCSMLSEHAQGQHKRVPLLAMLGAGIISGCCLMTPAASDLDSQSGSAPSGAKRACQVAPSRSRHISATASCCRPQWQSAGYKRQTLAVNMIDLKVKSDKRVLQVTLTPSSRHARAEAHSSSAAAVKLRNKLGHTFRSK